MSKHWISEFLLLGALMTGGALLGRIFGALPWFVLLGFVLFLVRWGWQLYRLESWLGSRRRHPPRAAGIWGHVFDEYYRLRQRQYKSKKRLAQVIREFRESTAAMPDGTLVLNQQFRIIWCNDAACRLLHLTDKRDLGEHVTNLVRNPRFIEYLNNANYETPVEIRSPVDNSRTMMLRLVPYGNEQYLLLIRDVTRLYRLQAMRRDFVANASHELRSPLTVLSGYLDSLVESGDLGEQWTTPLADMQTQCQRMHNLVNDLLELSRLQTEDADAPVDTRVDMPVVIRRAAKDAETFDDKDHELNLEINCPHGIAGVEVELYSVVSNLVANAVRYSPAGTCVEIRWYERDDGSTVLEVEDHGIGIDPKHVPFITQRFYRVDSSHARKDSGTGLGLAIVKHVLRRHGAQLEVDSRPGSGSVFRCVFPNPRVLREG